MNEDLLTGKPEEVIQRLKAGRGAEEPEIETYLNQYDPSKHDIFDVSKRPNKDVKSDKEGEATKTVKVARVALALQKLIVKRAVSFVFGNAVTLKTDTEDEKEKMVLDALKRILFESKSRTVNRTVAREIFSTTEAAELWYPVSKETEAYGFKSKFKLRVEVFRPQKGDKLYPYFDETGDMIAFSREFTRVEKGKDNRVFFETYTDTQHLQWEKAKEGWVLVKGYPKPIAIGKIPVVYGRQEFVEWEDVQGLIDRLEVLASNFADTNDYHASPKLVVKGQILGFSQKGESGAIIEVEGEDADVKYLAWDHAPESVKLEIEFLLRMIYTITQTPDISFDSVKGIGSISGVALKLLFADAHLKVQDKMEVFDDFLQRRMSIIQAYIGEFNNSLKDAAQSLMIEPEITPYIIEDEQALVDLLKGANGDKPVASQKSTIQRLGWAADADAEYQQIQDEEQRNSYVDVAEPGI